MPLIILRTSIKEGIDTDSMLDMLSTTIAKLTGKPRAYVMSIVEIGVPMSFAGSKEPTCYLEVKSIGSLNPSLISEKLCQLIEKEIQVPQSRIYINFDDVSASNWGYNGRTFG